jgi:NAD+ diphosphatase
MEESEVPMPDTSRIQSVYVFKGDDLAVPAALPESRYIEGVPLEALPPSFQQMLLLTIPGVDGDGPILWYDPGNTLPPDWKTVPVRNILPAMITGSTGGAVGRLLRAYHIRRWREESRFCGHCGGANRDDPHELARHCPVCGRLEFPRISPAIIVLIINDKEQALLAHNRKFQNRVYSLIAGFTEAGESLEATVVREVREEVGIEVRDIRYIASQPWPFPNSLMLGFTARHAGGVITPDGEEIEDAQWFNRDALPELPGHGSVSRYLINRWLEGKLP